VWVYENGDPPRQLAHYVLLHEYGDPPEKTRLAVNQVGDPPKDDATRRQDFRSAKPLRDVCDADGYVRYANGGDDAIFHLSLAEWFGENVVNRRVFLYIGTWWRHDLFTDADRRIMSEHMDREKEQLATTRSAEGGEVAEASKDAQSKGTKQEASGNYSGV